MSMLNEKLKRLCNVGLRGSTLASKFLLVFSSRAYYRPQS